MTKTECKIWIDLDNSPHVPLFIPIIEQLESRGYKTILTGRSCFQVRDLVKLHGIKCEIIGRHYGKARLLKLIGTLVRVAQLGLYIVRRRPQFAVSHGSRAQLILCKVLRIPTLMMDDYEHSTLMMFIRPDWLLVPAIMGNCEHRMNKGRTLTYPGIKEDAYVPRFRPESSGRAKLGLSEEQIIVTVRPPADEAHYHSPESDVLYRAVMEHLLTNSGVKIVLVPRSEKQAQYARTHWQKACNKGSITIPAKAVDGLSLIWHSDLLISGGGTMNREAAALGVPVYSIFRGPLGAVDRGLAEEGRLILLKCVDDIRTRLVLQRRPRADASAHRDGKTLSTIIEKITSAIEAS